VELVFELDQPSHHDEVGDVLFAAERAEHAGEVAGRGDGRAQAAADRLAFEVPLEKRVTSVDAFLGRVSGFRLCEPVRGRIEADLVLTLCNA
jgi:hypothetical protein